jgi:hypothetical protein
MVFKVHLYQIICMAMPSMGRVRIANHNYLDSVRAAQVCYEYFDTVTGETLFFLSST